MYIYVYMYMYICMDRVLELQNSNSSGTEQYTFNTVVFFGCLNLLVHPILIIYTAAATIA